MIITCDKLSKVYGAQRVLDGVSFSVNFAHTLVLIGPSGGGKSTLLRLLAGLITPEEGSLRVNDTVVPREENELRAYRKRIGVVFQSFNLFPHLTALENVQLPLERVHKFANAKERAMEALKRFRLEAHADKRPTELSGGQCQRVAIARALAVEPEFLLMDEPTSALDPEMTAEVLDVVAGLREAGCPLVLATHEMGFARKTADFVAFVADRQVLEVTKAEEFFTKPATNAAGRFLEKILKY